ncbi:MAG: hypothetical protein M5U26_14870 [Planctomycetota bacterium]|nr:hypothetical protein [Planctomycetota bacterium]
MKCAGLALALALAAFAPRGVRAETLADRVQEAHQALRDLERLYRLGAESERDGALLGMLARAAWLEQAGGLAEARRDQLLALARLKMRGHADAPRHGYLSGEGGRLDVELIAQPAEPERLPAELRPLAERLWLLRLANRGAAELRPGRPYLEQQSLTEQRLEAQDTDKLPAEFAKYAPLFERSERLAAGERLECLILLEHKPRMPQALGVSLGTGSPGGRESAVRAPLVEMLDPGDFAEARRAAVQLERAVEEERRLEAERQRLSAPKEPRPPEAPRPGPAQPAEKIPPAVGQCERAGAGEKIQVHMYERNNWREGDVFRVRVDGRWVGRVKAPAGASSRLHKTVFWFDLLEGQRDELDGGTLHPEE